MDKPGTGATRPIRLLSMLLVLLLPAGCATVKKVSQATVDATESVSKTIAGVSELKLETSNLRHRVAVGSFESAAGPEAGGGVSLFRTSLIQKLSSGCDKMVIVEPNEPGHPAGILDMTRRATGPFDNFVLARTARETGFNAVLTGSVIDVRKEVREKGLLWFRDPHWYLQVVSAVELYDAETAAKLTDESHLFEMEIEDLEAENASLKDESFRALVDAALQESAAELAAAVCEAVKASPWTGFVAAVREDGAVVLSQGANVGLTVGRELEVHATDQVMASITGERFFRPSPPVATVKVSSVTEDRALADPVSTGEAPIQPGYAVRPR
jgi:hypothetical protein